MSELQQFAELCEAAARAGGRVLCEWRERFSVREKAPRDLVTQADIASQAAIETMVRESYPSHAFVGEEGAADDLAPTAEYRWLVDPLDGTANYVHGLRPYGVSVALARGNDVLVGTVFDPTHDECFTAQRGEGAVLNGRRLRTSSCRRLSEALVACSFSANVHRESPEISRFLDVVVESQSLRRLGSAALNLCYLAAGQLDAYWTTNAQCWDVAAGLLLLQEAGGVITSVDGLPLVLDRPHLLAAATPELHAELLGVLQRSDRSRTA